MGGAQERFAIFRRKAHLTGQNDNKVRHEPEPDGECGRPLMMAQIAARSKPWPGLKNTNGYVDRAAGLAYTRLAASEPATQQSEGRRRQ